MKIIRLALVTLLAAPLACDVTCTPPATEDGGAPDGDDSGVVDDEDAGSDEDAGASADAGTTNDAGTTSDSGVAGDGGTSDGGVVGDGGTVPDVDAGPCTPTNPGDDSDGDGETNAEEAAGETIGIDGSGFGLNQADLLTMRAVTSDPCLRDTDGDGLTDAEEYQRNTDPRDADTDGDDLGDAEEVRRWNTSPVSVDSDGDSRGDPISPTAPNSDLFDGAELILTSTDGGPLVPGPRATSPSVADTDGDGVNDGVEFDDPIRSPVIADLPEVEITLTENATMRLLYERAEEAGVEQQVSTEISKEQGSSLSRSDSESTALSASLAVSVGATVEASLPPSASVSVEATATVGIEKTTSTEVTAETSTSASQSQGTMESESQSYTVVEQGGVLSAGVEATNTGTIVYKLLNLAIAVRQYVPGQGYTTLATLAPEGLTANEFVLAQNEGTGTIQFQDDTLDADLVRSFMRNPSSLLFEPVAFDLQAADGTSFAFLTENTFARTALVVIDKGDGAPVRLRVATNVARDTAGALTGVTVARALDDAEIDWETTPNGQGRKLLTRIDAASSTVHAGAAPDLGDPAYPLGSEPGPRVAKSFWVVFGASGAGGTFDTSGDFDDIVLTFQDELRLVYVQDQDQDGVYDREEFSLGASDSEIHSDSNGIDLLGDGLSDYFETRVGWTVDVTDPGVDPYPVYSNPTLIDGDGDGLNDAEEYALLTDPQLADTDGDGLQDDADSDPLAFTNTAPRIVVTTTTITAGTVRLQGTVDDDESNVVELVVDWGDGSADTIVTTGFPAFDVQHTYAGGGVQTITMVATDSADATDTDVRNPSVLVIPTDTALHLPLDAFPLDDISVPGVVTVNAGNGLAAGDLTTDHKGVVGKALNLYNDQTPSRVSVSNRALGANFSISAWVRYESGFSGFLFAGTTDGFAIYKDGTKIHFGKNNGATGGDTASQASEDTALAQATWAHYVGVVSGDGTSVKLYKNGVLQTDQPTITATVDNTTCSFAMGSRGADACTDNEAADFVNAFNGSVDDVRAYKRALTADEISALAAE